MKKFWKWVGVVLGVLAGLVVISTVVVHAKTQARLTRVYELPKENFIGTIRTVFTPDGRELRANFMPWRSYKFMDDEELKAVWVYLQSLPKKEYGSH